MNATAMMKINPSALPRFSRLRFCQDCFSLSHLASAAMAYFSYIATCRPNRRLMGQLNGSNSKSAHVYFHCSSRIRCDGLTASTRI